MAENSELVGVTHHPGRGGFGGGTAASDARAQKHREAQRFFLFILGYVLRGVCVSLMAALRACDDPNQQRRSFHINRFVAIALGNPPDEVRMTWDFPFVVGRVERKPKNLVTRLRIRGDKTKQWHYLVRKCEQVLLGFDYLDFHGPGNTRTFADSLALPMELEVLTYEERAVSTLSKSQGILFPEIHNYIFEFINPHNRPHEQESNPSSGQGAYEFPCTSPMDEVGSEIGEQTDALSEISMGAGSRSRASTSSSSTKSPVKRSSTSTQTVHPNDDGMIQEIAVPPTAPLNRGSPRSRGSQSLEVIEEHSGEEKKEDLPASFDEEPSE